MMNEKGRKFSNSHSTTSDTFGMVVFQSAQKSQPEVSKHVDFYGFPVSTSTWTMSGMKVFRLSIIQLLQRCNDSCWLPLQRIKWIQIGHQGVGWTGIGQYL